MSVTYSYTATGGATFNGCAATEKITYINYRWGENSVLYVLAKAQKGILEQVAIKRVILNSGRKTFNQVIPIYQDTLNSLWNENDLILEADARTLAAAYWEARQAAISANRCNY